MATPSYVTQQNVYFNGETNAAVVLSESDDVRKLILWDDLSVADQDILVAFVAANGGTAPAASTSPTSAKAELNYGAATGSSTTGLNGGTAATAGYQAVGFTTAAGATATGLANDTTAYTATITIDGSAKSVSVVGSAAQTFTTLVAEIQTDVGAAGTVAINGNSIRVTSATTGATSTVAIVDGTLFAAVAGFQSIATAVAGAAAVPATTYTATVTIDGLAIAVSVLGSAAQTFTTLVSEVQTDIGAAGTVALTSGKLVITSATTGVESTIAVSNGTLFGAVTGYAGTVLTQGADALDLWEKFQTTRSPNGALYSEVFRVLKVGEKPVILPHVPRTMQFTYFNGSEWLYMSDDTPVCAS